MLKKDSKWKVDESFFEIWKLNWTINSILIFTTINLKLQCPMCIPNCIVDEYRKSKFIYSYPFLMHRCSFPYSQLLVLIETRFRIIPAYSLSVHGNDMLYGRNAHVESTRARSWSSTSISYRIPRPQQATSLPNNNNNLLQD